MTLLFWFTLLLNEISITKQNLSCVMGNQRMPYSSWIRCSLESNLLRTIHKHLFVQGLSFRWAIKWLEKLAIRGFASDKWSYSLLAKGKENQAFCYWRGRGKMALSCKSYLLGVVFGFVLWVFLLLADRFKKLKNFLLHFETYLNIYLLRQRLFKWKYFKKLMPYSKYSIALRQKILFLAIFIEIQ